jgi:hypothetical protein
MERTDGDFEHVNGLATARLPRAMPTSRACMSRRLAEPEAFLRGLMHTDGWRGVNRVHVKCKGDSYPRYQFSNRSDDIRKLFTDTCENLGVRWRQWTTYHVSVARRESVAILNTVTGPKR